MTESERFNAIIAALPVALEMNRDRTAYLKAGSPPREITGDYLESLAPASPKVVVHTAALLVELAEEISAVEPLNNERKE